MTATIHKVAAGNGYQYYLRNVAANDVSARGRSSLADYYSAHGEAPGRWHGTGLAALGLQPGEEVTEEQMKSLLGLGRHPNADAIEARVYDEQIRLGAKHKDAARAADQASRLGNPFRVYAEVSEFRKRCAQAFAEYNSAHGFDPHNAIGDDERARIRTRVAFDMFCETYDRAPLDARELSGWVARNSRPNTVAVAGFDITFSPVKSVSVLWALAPRDVADKIELAHQRAVRDALAWLERNAVFTRLGRNGVRQVDVEGIVAACFTHRDSRAGDPDLHTHVVIANRVHTLDGKWRTLDGAAIYQALVTVSEIYNTRLEHHLQDLVGVEFAERPEQDPSKRPIREIVGIPRRLITAFSRRDTAITTRLGQLAAEFQQARGREPTPGEIYDLAERATLETRPIKHLLRSLAEQRSTWRAEAVALLGGRDALAAMVTTALNPLRAARPAITPDWVTRTAEHIIEVVSEHRSTWQRHNLRAEIERQLRGHVNGQDWEQVAEAVLTETISPTLTVARGDPDLANEPELRSVPALLRRRDGSSVHTLSGAQIYTSARMLSVERQLIDLSVQPGARRLPPDLVAAAVRCYNDANPDQRLNAGQISVIDGFASSTLRIRTTNAPAGTGKTTAMSVLTDAWHTSGGRVLGLAPTASAAAELGKAIGTRVETVDKILDVLTRHTPSRDNHALDREAPPSLPQWILDIDPDTLVIVDEHVKIGNLKRLRLLRFLHDRGATIRCIGDPHQLASIEAGGADTNMDTASPEATMTLTHVVRFASNAEATASLQLREGDPAALGWYLDNGRIHAGHEGATHDAAYTAWIADHRAGRDTIMLAANNKIVTELNARARADRIASDGGVGAECSLADGLRASVGDTIRTRRNNRRLRLGDNDWVRNGYAWTVTAVHPDGSLTATHLRPDNKLGHSVRVPADYVAAHVRLGYATTIDSAQGITADSCHVALTGGESLRQLYVALTRGIHANHVYVPTALDGSEGSFWSEPAIYPRTAVEKLLRIFGRDGVQKSAHTMLRDALDPHQRIGRALDIYLDALGVAAETALGADGLERLDVAAEAVRPNLTDSPAYPVLRQHLAMIALSGRDPVTALRTAASARELDTADDVAAVLDWRLDPSGAHSTTGAPLPWASGIPRGLRTELDSTQLAARARIVTDLATQIRTDTRSWTPTSAPHWARPLISSDPSLLEDLAVWRASLHIDDRDPRPTGPPRYTQLEREHQDLLNARVTDALGDLHAPANKWAPLITRLESRILTDPWWPILADKIEIAHRSGIDIQTRLTHAAALRALPDDMPAAALWSRLELELVAAEATSTHNLNPDWTNTLHQIIGADTAQRVINDHAWSRLVAAIDRATGTDWTPTELLTTAYELILAAQPDPTSNLRPDQFANALAWRIDALLHESTHPNSQPTQEPTVHISEHHPDPHPHNPPHHDTAAQPTRQPLIRPTETTSVDETPLSGSIATIAALFKTGDIPAARRAFHDLANTLTDEQRDIIEAVATTLYRNHFRVALARLRWAADQFPEHRELIRACTPATDPHLYQSDTDHLQPPNQPDQHTHHYPDRRDPTRARPPRTAAETAAERASQDYRDTRADVDTDPEHLPKPDGVPHHYYREKLWEDRYPDYEEPDYDRQTTRKTHALPCVSCGITRPHLDSRPIPPRRSDDGLCGECRADNQPGIPDHPPADHIRARCDYIATVHPPNTILGLLKRDWRAARTLAERLAIATWVEDHPLPDTPTPTTEPTTPHSDNHLDMSDPVQMLTDDQLAQAITDISQRIDLAETEAILYGPAPGTASADTTAVDTTTWLHNELIDLNTEQHRRTQLTPEQTTGEHALRARHQHDNTTEDPTEYESDPIVDLALGYDDDFGL
ncbi:MobF family relaxase [Nocardia vinacea]|uniref:MobF family relaxase n=1 Tax=Nocardia vinacea TaxID=96468 RepID=UPI0033FFEF4E